MAINDIFKIAVVGRFPNGQDFVNVHYYKQLVSYVVTPPEQGLAEDFNVGPLTLLLQGMSNNMIVDQLEVRQVSGGGGAYDLPLGLPGTGGAGDMLTTMDAPLTSWRTALIGRANRGRTYWPSALESMQANGVLTGAAITFYQNVSNAHITVYDSLSGLVADWQKVIFHTDSTDSPVVTTGLVRNLIATQKRRRT